MILACRGLNGATHFYQEELNVELHRRACHLVSARLEEAGSLQAFQAILLATWESPDCTTRIPWPFISWK